MHYLLPLFFWLAVSDSLAFGQDRWLVFPGDLVPQARRKHTIWPRLVAILGDTRVEPIGSRVFGTIEFWKVWGTEAQMNQIRQINGVEDVVMDEALISTSQSTNTVLRDVNDPNLAITRQYDAPNDLKLVSWPPLANLPEAGLDVPYQFANENGQDTFVYVIDQGINIAHQDFTMMHEPPRPADWLFTSDAKRTYTDDDPDGHGSCVASKAVGHADGVSKFSRLIPVKTVLDSSNLLEAFFATQDDIIENKRSSQSVIVCSLASRNPVPLESWKKPPAPWKTLRRYLDSLTVTYGATIVLSAGNNASRSEYVDTFPAQFGEDPGLAIIVAGATTQRGYKSSYSQALKRPTFWAPGDKIICAAGSGTQGTVVQYGTSFSAPLVHHPLREEHNDFAD
ncbi:uncharacterized protein KY384_001668 [Bacidia gigantensis]|uniref:uncharacterized protein n=1 Tax=Bacidia gigantensis TaxID=2732470 RepID=UPI001D05B88D|nr:uncharacterized protein KY384_001668 [Bacidia gigantensis]KAG8533927.1 hypothetical protein KY384_001668 [Bacidia gigantensis]